MQKSYKLRGALTVLLSVSALLIGVTNASADVIDTYAVSDPNLVDSTIGATATASGTLTIDLTSGRVTAADIGVAVLIFDFNLTSVSQSIDTGKTGADVLVQSSGNDLDLDILTNTSNGLFPSTFSGGSVIAGNDTFFLASGGQLFTPFGAGSLTFESSNQPSNPPPTVPEPATLPLLASGLGALILLGWRRKRKSLAPLS